MVAAQLYLQSQDGLTPMMKLRLIILALLFIGIMALAYMYSVATRDAVIRTANIAMPDWPGGTPPMKVMLISDVHVAGPDMPPARLARIVEQVNATKPDLVLFAGDFVSDKRTATKHYDPREGLAPLAGLNARLGAVAVMGNHDHWYQLPKIRATLKKSGVEIVDNGATLKGPLVIGGVDDDFTGHAKVKQTLAAMKRLQINSDDGAKKPRLMLSHSPDIMPEIPGEGADQFIPLVLAGHTHCGQISFPIVGPLTYISRYGNRYACGVIKEEGKTLIVGAGLGTSILPLRLGAAPDMWLLTIGPL